jgi:hypothetical protein
VAIKSEISRWHRSSADGGIKQQIGDDDIFTAKSGQLRNGNNNGSILQLYPSLGTVSMANIITQ